MTTLLKLIAETMPHGAQAVADALAESGLVVDTAPTFDPDYERAAQIVRDVNDDSSLELPIGFNLGPAGTNLEFASAYNGIKLGRDLAKEGR